MSSRPRALARSLAVLGAAAVLFGATPARAFPEAPGIIQEELQLKCLPSCTLCHDRPEGGPAHLKGGTELQDGKRGYGAFFPNLIWLTVPAAPAGKPTLPRDAENLRPYLYAFNRPSPGCGGQGNPKNPQGDACDSDGDGATDLKELQDGTDPDVPDKKGPYSCLVPEYGCGASVAPMPRGEAPRGRSAALLAALGVGLFFARRFKR